MLYWLLYQQLYPTVRAFNVFHYVTTRAMLASLTSLFLCIALGPWLIAKLHEFQIGQHIREDGPQSHQKKAGTPTMGGVLIIISIIVPTLLWADLRHVYVWIALFALAAFGVIGFIDDYAKVSNKRNLGLTAKRKFAYQMLVAAIITVVLGFMQYYAAYSTTLNVPFI
ncbi:MAG: phospho-N-acetylmuramoyl-pentapeptide-transferase, partial [Terriglobia bacterium]